jgi:hypothetical protein
VIADHGYKPIADRGGIPVVDHGYKPIGDRGQDKESQGHPVAAITSMIL